MRGDQGELAIFLAYVHIRIAKVLAIGCWGDAWSLTGGEFRANIPIYLVR